ncbi:hypothetical protein AIOL_004201 [Candidatus Rhodobacter oscarellae]|uniref:Flagellar protein FlgN n=1 Tax=Candidatus Rhodobacter oscarellae TaxID=1675527 RepID=A0A0J9E8W0_9RHOB|nr:flagellar protein FlgN [Candidatus Rhodobacter lobularis]KMW59220.1 hypothetical protein AIOL_004201 [Candidatus Rhodobacter lobularis]
MGFFDVQDTHEALEDLLTRERAAILSGEYERLEGLAVEKERLVNALAKTRVDPDVLTRLREQTERNGILYDAMRAGIGSALDRLRAMREPRPGLSTYDQSGQKTEMATPSSKEVRRA